MPHKNNADFHTLGHDMYTTAKSIEGSADIKYSLVMVGCGGVGKSSITFRFVYDEFDDVYDPTKADSYRKRLINQNSGDIYDIDILDTAGQEEYAAIRDNYYRSGEGYILVFSVTERSSFMAIPEFYSQICRATNDPYPSVLLLGNKIDLLDLDSSQVRARAVSSNEAESLTEKWGNNCCYREVSAKMNCGVEDAFLRIIRIIENKKRSEGQVNRYKYKKGKSKCKGKGKGKKLFKCTIQ